MTKNEHERRLQSVRRRFARERHSPLDVAEVVQCIESGKELDTTGVLVFRDDHDARLSEWIADAASRGDEQRKQRLEVLRAVFDLFCSKRERKEYVLAKAETIKTLSVRCSSPAVRSFALGSLGALFMSHGLTATALDMTEKAVKAARQGGMGWAELQWLINCALLRANEAPAEADRELRRLLSIARAANDQNRLGIILNNLAIVNERQLGNLSDATVFQEEAVEIARAAGDKVSEVNRVFHLGWLLDQVGRHDAAMAAYDSGLACESEVEISMTGFEVFRMMSQRLVDKYREDVEDRLASHIRKWTQPQSAADIESMFELSDGGVVMGGWDPNRGNVTLIPDNAFASELVDAKEWAALTVYAQAWLEQSFLAGDGQGFYWLAVALRSLGYGGAADAALQLGMNVPRALLEDPGGV